MNKDKLESIAKGVNNMNKDKLESIAKAIAVNEYRLIIHSSNENIIEAIKLFCSYDDSNLFHILVHGFGMEEEDALQAIHEINVDED